MNIGFIGYRNSGKSTLSKAIKDATNREIFNTDLLIKQQFQMDIPQIVDTYGWHAFRLCEKLILSQISKMKEGIFDFGGGVILHPKEMEILQKQTFIIYLESDADTLYRRSCNNYFRPALTALSEHDEIVSLLKERRPQYEHYADYVLNTRGLTVNECREKILQTLQSERLFIQRKYLISKEKVLCESYC